MVKPTKKDDDAPQQQDIEDAAGDKAEPRPTRAQFNEAANVIEEVDEQLDALNAKRNEASDVVRRYLGRKR